MVAIGRRTSSDTVRFDIQAPLDPRHNFSADNRAYNTIWDGHNDTKPFRIPSISIASLSLSFEAHLGPFQHAWSLALRTFTAPPNLRSINYPNLVPELKCRDAFPAVCAGHFFVASSDSPVLKFTQRFFGLHAPNLLGHNRVVALQERLVYQTTTSQKCREPKQAQESARTASPNCNISHRELSRLLR